MSVSKIVAAAASGVGGAGLDVDEVFSTTLYDGNGGTQTITNGIDLTEGGLVWSKDRDTGAAHNLADTIRGGTKALFTHNNSAEFDRGSDYITSFNSNGYSIGADGLLNDGDYTYVSWTFRKAKKFFDVVTYTGDGTSSRQISHDLGTTVGMTIVKCTSHSQYWHVLHRSGNAAKSSYLNRTDAEVNDTYAWNSTHATSTHFTVGAGLNTSGRTFVAYLFAHNNNDGGFGPKGNQDIIKCGSYTGNGTTSNFIDLGFEPQWYLVKCSSHSGTDWLMVDSMRGMSVGNNDAIVMANLVNSEITTDNRVDFAANGFFAGIGGNDNNASGRTYIYMAIRRGSLNTPEDATKVFSVTQNYGGGGSGGPAGGRQVTTGFPVDFFVTKEFEVSGGFPVFNRLTSGEYQTLGSSSGELDFSAYVKLDYSNGYNRSYQHHSSNMMDYAWKRAPGYFDVCTYTGNGTSGRTVTHNLGVAPEMMWVKKRNGNADWTIYHSATGATKYLETTNAYAVSTNSARWNDTAPTSSVFSLGDHSNTNATNDTFTAYLFASAPGVSKVGSVVHSGSSTDVDCGFAAGARFVLMKRTDASGDWYIWDSVRGIVSGNDPYLRINVGNTQITNTDYIDPLSSGFQITGDFTDGTYIFYAIA
jgi:hypothetical protein